MINRLTKKIAYVLCISSLMSLTTVQSMPEDNKNPEHGGDGKNIVQDNKNPEQDDNSKNIAQDDKTPKQNSYEIENGILGVQRDIFLMLSGMLFERQLSNMIGFSGESTKWLNHRNYTIYRNRDRVLLERLCKSLTRWKTIPPRGDLRNFHMVYNGKAIVIIADDVIYRSEDGEIYKKIKNSGIDSINDIYDVIVAKGKYIATTGYSLLISNSGKKWKEHKCPKYIVKMAYDKSNEMYYGISQDDYRHNVYASKDITKLGTHSSEIAGNLPDNSLFHICCGNGMFVVSVVGRRATYYLKEDVLERSGLTDYVFDMSYNPQTKLIVAVTKCSSMSTTWNIYTTKNASEWKKEVNSKKLAISMFGSFDKKPAITTIAGYSVVLMQSGNGVKILIRKKNRKWIKMKEEISGIDMISQIRKFIRTDHGIFMLTDHGMKKAVGNIESNSEDDVDYETNYEDDVDSEDERIHAVNPANTENTAIVKYVPNIFEMKNVPSEVNANLFLQLSEILFRIQLRNIFDFSAEYMMLLNNDNIRLGRLSRLLTNWEDVPLNDEIKGWCTASNGKTIVVAGYNGISCSIDGETYNEINNHNINDIIVADGKYVAISCSLLNGAEISTSDDGINWNDYPFNNNNNIARLAYDDVNKMYYGIGKAKKRCNIYANKDITKLGNKIVAHAPSSSSYTCCGNGIFVISDGYKTCYLYKDSLKRSDLHERVVGMSYNPQSKRIMAVTKPYCKLPIGEREPVSWNIHSTKDGRYWEKELNTKDNFIESTPHFYDYEPLLTTIDNYSILFITHPVISILIKKNDGEWAKISEIRGINQQHLINQIVKTNNGIFMITNYGIKKAVGNMMPAFVESNKAAPRSEDDVTSDINPKHRLRVRNEHELYALSHEERELRVLRNKHQRISSSDLLSLLESNSDSTTADSGNWSDHSSLSGSRDEADD